MDEYITAISEFLEEEECEKLYETLFRFVKLAYDRGREYEKRKTLTLIESVKGPEQSGPT